MQTITRVFHRNAAPAVLALLVLPIARRYRSCFVFSLAVLPADDGLEYTCPIATCPSGIPTGSGAARVRGPDLGRGSGCVSGTTSP
eukprot:SAG31_NODE_28621_length_407_cov_1.162338_1_plen_85_part_01